MVAFSSSRRKPGHSRQPAALDTVIDAGSGSAAASRRASQALAVRRGRSGEILAVRIGAWRTISASPQRQIAELRELQEGRVAVCIQRSCDGGGPASSQIWQLYDRQGRLEAALQTTPDRRFAIQTNYVTRRACRLVMNRHDEWETVETWRI